MNDETITKPILRYFYSHVTSAMHKNLSAYLVSTLAGLQMNDFTHFYARKYTNSVQQNSTARKYLNSTTACACVSGAYSQLLSGAVGGL